MSDKLIDPVEKLARELAMVEGQFNPDMIVVPDWPPPMRVARGFLAVPRHGQPLWTFFVPTARRALEVIEGGK